MFCPLEWELLADIIYTFLGATKHALQFLRDSNTNAVSSTILTKRDVRLGTFISFNKEDNQ
jgi:hypothetical protein